MVNMLKKLDSFTEVEIFLYIKRHSFFEQIAFINEIETWWDFGPAPVTAASSVTVDMRRLVKPKSDLAIERWFRAKLNLDMAKIW